MLYFSCNLLEFFAWLNNDFLALPGALLFLTSALILTFKTRFIQIRALPQLFKILLQETEDRHHIAKDISTQKQTVSPLRALFTALATSMGMGNIVGPAVAIFKGGPGALFWLLVYIFLASATKFTEVVFAVHTRSRIAGGHLSGGPMEYLRTVSPFLSSLYGAVMVILFVNWSSIQSNTLATIYALEGVPPWMVGITLSLLALFMVSGGVKRISSLALRLVPLKFSLYVLYALLILLQNPYALMQAIGQVFYFAFTPAAVTGGFLGATVFTAMRYGIFRGVFISESGLGTAAIPHALANTQTPVNQGILAMGSAFTEMILSSVSGLLVLVTGIWLRGEFRTTLVYEVFKSYAPFFGATILLIIVSLFVVTTVIGNTFNGMQNFYSLARRGRWANAYLLFAALFIFLGSLMPVPLVWEILDFLLFFAAVPNLIGILYLAFTQPEVIAVGQEKDR